MSSLDQDWIVDDLPDVCAQFQFDLSCLVDRELSDNAAKRAVAHLDRCELCSEFFDDVRDQVRAHRQLSDPEKLIDQYSSLVGKRFESEVEGIELVSRLAGIFYQLGKAYVLCEANPDFRIEVFEESAPVEATKNHGRGLVDGILERGHDEVGGLDLRNARHMFNGRLSRMESHGERGRRLLQECLGVDPTHDEARLYLAFLDKTEGRRIRAARGFRTVFNEAVLPENRAHAAVQLGRVYAEERDFRKAIACCRWIVSNGFADEDSRFFVARLNIAMYWAHLGEPERAVSSFRDLLDRNAAQLPRIQAFFLNAPVLHAAIQAQPGFAERLMTVCPELVEDPNDSSELVGSSGE